MRTLKFRCFDNKSNKMIENCSHVQREGIEIMQFTGLLDRHGKEIYEGDIVKGMNLENFEWIEPVTFIDNGWFPFIEHRAMTDFEVIGNIYENPELLKGDDDENN